MSMMKNLVEKKPLKRFSIKKLKAFIPGRDMSLFCCQALKWSEFKKHYEKGVDYGENISLPELFSTEKYEENDLDFLIDGVDICEK